MVHFSRMNNLISFSMAAIELVVTGGGVAGNDVDDDDGGGVGD